ncbi:MAG: AbrB/MazE/SpoVT family DNA-binding domain-containing protein [Candidatus Eremiobacteraeota bacterium]|nr:AbrB/MazE/SpoVT family DNA-binding domain-containing protein [Candidatus Eremiobacteraeota bacterium]
MAVFQSETVIRARNQITIPKEIAEARGLRKGQHLVFLVDDDRPDELIVRPLRDSYAGILTGIYGRDAAEREAYIRGEREAWS